MQAAPPAGVCGGSRWAGTLAGRVLRVAWIRFRATFRRRWGGYLALAVLVGLVGGLAMGSIAAAWRTYSSCPQFLAGTNPSDLIGQTVADGTAAFAAQLARMPHVQQAADAVTLNAATITPRGGIGTFLASEVQLVASTDGLYSDQDRVTIVQGRRAEAARPGEIVMNRSAASALRLHVGSRIPVEFYRGGGGGVPCSRRSLPSGAWSSRWSGWESSTPRPSRTM
jgi:hypothetical protein